MCTAYKTEMTYACKCENCCKPIATGETAYTAMGFVVFCSVDCFQQRIDIEKQMTGVDAENTEIDSKYVVCFTLEFDRDFHLAMGGEKWHWSFGESEKHIGLRRLHLYQLFGFDCKEVRI